MKERPILFSGPMVRAILDGRKTMTRRVVKPQPHLLYQDRDYKTEADQWGQARWISKADNHTGAAEHVRGWDNPAYIVCPYGAPGDRLWVRETFGYPEQNEDNGVVYRATDPTWDEATTKYCKTMLWKPSIFMPRLASRITLEITGVRVERLQEITEPDAVAEGVEPRTREKGYTIVCRGGGTFEVSSLYERGVPAVGDASPFGEVTHVEQIPERVLISTPGVFRLLWMKINGRSSWDANPWVWVVEFRRVKQ